MVSPSTSPHLEHTRPPTAGSSSRTSSSRCNQCIPGQTVKGRNLVVCIDGTCNESGPNSTNVVKLYINVDRESTSPKQLAFYIKGLGTHPKSRHCSDQIPEQHVPDLSGIGSGEKSGLTALLEKTIALNVEKAVKEAYQWLAETYQEGDQIYLFGVSRGAYQVRVLAGMIHEVGLIKEMITENEIGKAYDYYEAVCQGKPTAMRTAREFKNTVSWQGVKVHFVGVWDTVSSVLGKDVFLSMSSSAEHACHFRHALALDERRVTFMPEYFYEVNSQMGVGKSMYTATSCDIEQVNVDSATDLYQSTLGDDGTDHSGIRKNPDIKEVWFAGSHSDVGGQSRPGEFRNAGHVSLLWMRREAAANGLVLNPTDIVWLPDDLDSGISNSMTRIWRAVEYLPIKHQVSFSGAGEHAVRRHRQQARRIIPGQKVHASVLYANTYKPKATLGEGFDIPIIYSGHDDVELDDQFWETGLFDDTAAQELLTSLSSRQGVSPIYLDRLLFLLRFKEGKRCIREVADWQAMFMKVITDRHCPALVRLVAIVAYHEASCDPNADPEGCAPSPIELSQNTFPDAKERMEAILAAYKHGNGPTVVALLRLLTRHQILRERVLSRDILEALVDLLDAIIEQPVENFGQAMGALTCFLQCLATRRGTIEKLEANPSKSNQSRLSRILEVDDSHRLTAALHVTLTLARIPEARAMCTVVKPRIRVLATKREGLVGHLAAESLLVLYDPNDQKQLDIHDTRVRANLTSALVRLNLEGHDSADGEGSSVDLRQQILRRLFGLDATQLSDSQKKLIAELKKAVEVGDVRERTVATMTLLKLCETPIIRTQLHEIKLLDVFVSQLQQKDNALLAAYALVTCLKYSDMKTSIEDNKDWPKHIIKMLEMDCFDDALGAVEGFRVFEDLMQDADLRKRIVESNIIHVLETKLGNGKLKENRMGLICLDIIRTCDPSHSWTDELVGIGLKHLKSSKTWEAGTMILSALSQTDHGLAAVCLRIHEIIEMLLPGGYRRIQPTPPQTIAGLTQITNHILMSLCLAATQTTLSLSTTLRDSAWPPSWVTGPVYALRILAQNETLRNHTRETVQYSDLKIMYYGSGAFSGKTGKWPWQKRDTFKMLDEMFKAVEQ